MGENRFKVAPYFLQSVERMEEERTTVVIGGAYIQCCSSGGQNKRDVLCSQNRYRTGLGGKEREWERKMERERERERERKTMK